MGDPAGQVAQAVHLLGVLDLALGLELGGHVQGRRQHPLDPVDGHQLGVDQAGDGGSVPGAGVQGHSVDAALLLKLPLHPVAPFGGDPAQLDGGPAQDLLPGMAGNAQEGFVDVQVGARLHVAEGHQDGGPLEGQGERLFAFAHGDFGPSALGHVMDDGEQLPAALEQQRSAEHLHLADRAIGQLVPELEVVAPPGPGPFHFRCHFLGGQHVDLLDALAQELLPGPPVEVDGGLIGVEDLALVGVDDQHGRHALLEGRLVAGLHLVQALQGADPAVPAGQLQAQDQDRDCQNGEADGQGQGDREHGLRQGQGRQGANEGNRPVIITLTGPV